MRDLHLKNASKTASFTYLLFKMNVVFAATAMPWEGPMQAIADSVTGPLLLCLASIMIVVTCLMLAFGEWGQGFKVFLNMVVWISVAFGVASLLSMFS